MASRTFNAFLLFTVFISSLCIADVGYAQESYNIRDHNFVVARDFTTENGLPANGINGMYQDQKGYIWAATYNGLVRYNGLDFKVYNMNNLENLESNRFTSVNEDQDGNIWAGLELGGFLVIDAKTDSATTYSIDPEKYGSNVKTTVIEFGSDNRTWIGTSIGVFVMQDGEMTYLDHLPNEYVNHLAFRNGHVYVLFTNHLIQLHPDGTAVHTIARLNNDSVRIENSVVNRLSNVVQFMDFHYVNNDLYLMTEAGLLRYDEEAEIVLTSEDVNQSSLQGFLPQEDTIFVYGRDGIFSMSLSGSREIVYYSRLSVIDLMIDHEESLWAASLSNGIVQFISTPVYQGDDFATLDQQGITGVLAGRDGATYVGANCDGVYRFTDENIQRFGEEDGIQNECVWSLMEQSNGTLWVGTWGDGVYYRRTTGQQFERFTPGEFQDVSVFLSIFEDSNGSIWFGTYSNGLYRQSNSEIVPVKDSEGETLAAVRMIFESKNGDIFVATDEGVGILQGNEIHDIQAVSELGLSNFRTITQDASGRFWFGSYGGGLVVYEPGEEPRVLSTQDGLFDNTISQLAFDEDQDLWLGGNLGVFYIPQDQVKSFLNGEIDRLRVSRIGVSEGMTIRETNGGFMPSSQLTENGELLIPTVQGVNVINTRRMELNEEPPNTFIEEIEIDGQIYSQTQLESIPHSAHRIIFRFSGLSYKNPEYNRYEYMLEDFDQDWLSARNSGEAIYSMIPAGDYSFKVRASNNDRVWSTQAATISFSVDPPFWQTIWFYLGIVALSGILIVVAFRYRLRSIQIYNRQLERKVDERTEELKVSNEELKKHIEEKNKLQSILAHDLKNPFSAILGYIELIKNEFEQKGEHEQVDMMKMLLDSGRNTLALLENLLQWSNSKEGGLEPKFESIDITELVDQAISMTDAQSTFKNIFVRNLIEKPHYVRADRNMILSVIRNLISNAIKFSGRDSIVEISLEEKDDKVIVSVEDSGVGIPQEEQDKLFTAEKMQQKVGTQGEKGIGMGLMLCKEFIEKHNEEIWVTSAPKKGSTFSFSLKTATEHEEKQVDKSEE
ncbi:MAG: two-component regulator propeller domain-containing protein [Balneolaceae bacterium]|nr:two-component regulator propeller domain-containing protein [Balneolaceae bacterium]